MRRRHFSLSIVAIGAVIASIPASADTGWTGLYVGGHGGYGRSDLSGVFDSGEGTRGDLVLGSDFNLKGGIGGVHVGYNLQSGRLVTGLEADFSFMDWSGKISDPEIEGSRRETDNVSAGMDWLATIRGRAGFTSGSALVYATGGVAFVGGDWAACDCDNGDADIGDLSLDNTGLVFGGGIEADLGGNWSLRSETLYYAFGGQHAATSLNADSDPGDYAGIDDIWVARLGLSYRFGRSATEEISLK